jgi:hypothetical protein
MANGALLKLTIIPFKNDSDTQDPTGLNPLTASLEPPFVAQFNPESFTVNKEIEYETNEASGSDGGEAKFVKVNPRKFSFDLLFDGTGAAGLPPTPASLIGAIPIPNVGPLPGADQVGITTNIELFKRLVGYKGDTHRPRFFIITWGTFFARCVLESYSINYKLFSPLGVPLRAVISTSWREYKAIQLTEFIKNMLSPDVTHQHTIRENEHLSLVTYGVYEDPRYYYEVGEKNELDNLRKLNPGDSLQLFPLK